MKLKPKIIWRFVILALLSSCLTERNNSIEGNWAAIDDFNNYSELYIKNGTIRVYEENVGYINPQMYTVKFDSLKTNIHNYKIIIHNSDSIEFRSEDFNLYLSRISQGFLLSEFTEDSLEQKYKEDFYDRLYKRKGVKKLR